MLLNKRIINKTKNSALAERVETAGTWLTRLRGLMFRRKLPAGSSLVLFPCSSVHTCFMRFNLDLVFLSKTGEVLHVMEDVVPFRFSPLIRKAALVLEMNPGAIKKSGTEPGDILNLSFSGILAGNNLVVSNKTHRG